MFYNTQWYQAFLLQTMIIVYKKNSQNLQAITIKLVKSSLATREVWNNHEVTVAEPKSWLVFFSRTRKLFILICATAFCRFPCGRARGDNGSCSQTGTPLFARSSIRYHLRGRWSCCPRQLSEERPLGCWEMTRKTSSLKMVILKQH